MVPNATSVRFELLLPLSAALAASLAASAYLVVKWRNNKLPPINKVSLLQTIEVMSSSQAPDFLMEKSKELGTVFRLNMPDIAPWIIVCESSLARKILEEHDEKNWFYKQLSGLGYGRLGIFAKNTYGEGWEWARKGVAASFSMKNLALTLPRLHKKLDDVISLLNQFAADKKEFPCGLVGIDLILDFLMTSMFETDLRTIHDESEGKLFEHKCSAMMKEFGMKQPLNPLRRYMFWDKEVQQAKQYRDEVYSFLFSLIQKYRETHTPEETASDTSIMGALMRRFSYLFLFTALLTRSTRCSPYPSELHRAVDMFTFVVAGHETTGYSLSWILIEICRHPEVYIKIIEELQLKIPSNTTHLSFNDVCNLPYLDMVIKEGIRLWPVTGAFIETPRLF